jgi:hypothetical protein
MSLKQGWQQNTAVDTAGHANRNSELLNAGFICLVIVLVRKEGVA